VVDTHGHVQHDIFAYSNGYGNERALVIFNNRYSHAAGWIKQSVGFRPHPDDPAPIRRTLSQGLGLGNRDWCLFTDLTTGFNYIRSASDLANRGLYLELGAYKHHVFSDFRSAPDDSAGDMARLAQYLGGRGVPDLDQALWEIKLEYVLEVFARLLSLLAFRGFITLVRTGLRSEADREAFYAVFETQLAEFISQSQKVVQRKLDPKSLNRWAEGQLRATIEFLGQDALQRLKDTKPGQRFLEAVEEETLDCSLRNDCGLKLFYSLLVMQGAFRVMDQRPARELFLERLREALETTGLEEAEAYDLSLLVQILTDDPATIVLALEDLAGLRTFLERPEVLQYLHCHWHSDVYWFVKERLLGLLYWMFAVTVLECGLSSDTKAVAYRRRLVRWSGTATRAVELAARSGFDFNRFLDLLRGQPTGD